MGVMKIINLAHGELMMVPCTLRTAVHPPSSRSLPFRFRSHARVVFLWSSLQKYLINPVLKVESILPENQVILTVGHWHGVGQFATIFFTSNYRSTPVDYATKAFYLTDFLEKRTHRAFPFLLMDLVLLDRRAHHHRALVLPDAYDTGSRSGRLPRTSMPLC